MYTETHHMVPATPHIFVLIMCCVALLTAAFTDRKSRSVYFLVQFTLLVTIWLVHRSFNGTTEYEFSKTFVSDGMSYVLNMFIPLFVFVTFLYSRQYVEDRDMPRSEYYLMGLLATLGMMVLVSSGNLITLYLGLELLALPTYAMVAMQRNNGTAIEAAMKYFVIGAMATGLLLYGLSIIFGATGSLDLHQIAKIAANTPGEHNMMLILGLVFIIAGIAFKLGAAPFHLWVPDVFEGAPTSAALFIAAAPKVAAFAMIVRLLVQALPSLSPAWSQMLIVLAIASMGIGNLSALVQTNVKRLLGYSSIAHMGYFILGLACATPRGFSASLFYMITYAIMTLVAFGLLILFSKAGYEVETLDDLRGLHHRNPWMAFVMMIVMFSMAGIPPFVGFMAKLGILEALINVHLVWAAVVMIVFAIIGVYYYLRVVKVMYFEQAPQPAPFRMALDGQVAITVNGLFILLLGLFPGSLYTLCHSVFIG
ncbi:MAG: NADH-quinone oxidoreductase subunit NuoN [Coxiellaceae bacterium]|nr:NADH-quinone oxidoreductase subunit NuoN [Coxiellaceae bacterium]